MRRVVEVCLSAGLFLLLGATSWSQTFSGTDRGRVEDMLKTISGDIRKHYYDANLHGVDWDATVDKAKRNIDRATSMGMALSDIAAAVDTLNDSHTFFLPPPRPYRLNYGFEYEMVGPHCFVTRVRPKSDAEEKGLKPGDEVLSLNGFTPARDDLWKMHYVFTVLRPQPSLQLVLQDPAGKQRQLEVAATIHQGKRIADMTGENDASDIWDVLRDEQEQAHLNRARYMELSDQVFILKIPIFDFTPIEIGEMMGKARKHQGLVIDLRGNPGGGVDTLERLLGEIFDRDVKIADRVGRKERKPLVAKSVHDPFQGKIIVLVDSNSASAAEVFARVIQLEKRGQVFGDRTAGAVMEAGHYGEKIGADVVTPYGVSITDADLIMADGKSLEHVGVTPDRLLIPSASAFAAGRDPVLSLAVQELGGNLSSEQAGKLFPYEWAPE